MSRLYRSRNDRIIGGVCGGIAEYGNFDPAVVRVISALIVLFSGVGLILYLVMWAVIPEKPRKKSKKKSSKKKSKKKTKKKRK